MSKKYLRLKALKLSRLKCYNTKTIKSTLLKMGPKTK